MTAVQDIVALTPAGALDKRHFIGYYFWYSIRETMTPLRQVRRAFVANGLDVSRLPLDRRPEHVMQEACRSVEQRREGLRAEPIARDSNVLVYEITRRRSPLLRVSFQFDSTALSFEALDGDAQALIDEISSSYDANATQMPGRKLRTIVRHYVEAAGAESIRGDSGGIYFMAMASEVPPWSKLRASEGPRIDGRDFIQRIRMMLEDVYGTAPNFHSHPVLNDEGQREFLRRQFIVNLAGDLGAFCGECDELVQGKNQRSRGFRTDRIDNILNQHAEIGIRLRRFAAILGEALSELEPEIALADRALARFLDEVGQ